MEGYFRALQDDLHFESFLEAQASVVESAGGIVFAKNSVGYPVAVEFVVGTGRLCFVPSPQNVPGERVGAAIARIVETHFGGPAEIEMPAWVGDVTVPGAGSNSFPHNLLSDPHPLNPAVSIFYKNSGGRGPVRCLERPNVQTCRRSNALLIHPLSFLHFTDTPTQRPSYNSFGINSLRTLFIATEGVPLAATISRKSGLGGRRRRIDRRAGAFL